MTWSAASYDAWFERPWGRYAYRVETGAILEALGPLVDRRVLDAGCGTGRLLPTLQAAGSRAVGFDLAPDMVAFAAGRAGTPLVCADAAALPFGAGSFDAVAAVALLEFVARPADVVGELCRVTRPGGRVVVGMLNPRSPWGFSRRSSLRRPPWTGARFLDHRQLLALGRGWGRATVRGALFAPGPRSGARFGRVVEGIGRLFPRAGAFQVLTIFPGRSELRAHRAD
jgi:SAM-dependent methyltransferase